MHLKKKECYLVTGSAGFIGFHLSRQLLSEGHDVVGLDNLNDYYSVDLKKDRNKILLKFPNYNFLHLDLADKKAVFKVFEEHVFTAVFHLAAQAGVRYSLENPEAYLTSNVTGTFHILEAARHLSPGTNLMLASSSSVYGLSTALPFREDDSADRPVALYGATKRSTELMAHSYSHLFSLRTTMLRFFSVYGPWGRPDVALFKFVDEITHGKEIEVYNGGDMIRDFTYVEDIVSGLVLLEKARRDAKQPFYDIFNLGCSSPRTLMDFILTIEKALGIKAKLNFKPFQNGDIYKSQADITKITRLCGWTPKIQMENGIEEFVRWYKDYFFKP